jgi:hypothetical protein
MQAKMVLNSEKQIKQLNGLLGIKIYSRDDPKGEKTKGI